MAKKDGKKTDKSDRPAKDGDSGSVPSTSASDAPATTTPKPPAPATVSTPSRSSDAAAATGSAARVDGVVGARGEDTGSAARTSVATPTEVSDLAGPSHGGGGQTHGGVDVETTTPTSALTEPGGDAAEAARRASPGSSAPVTADTPTPVEALVAPAGRGSPAPGARPGLPLAQTSDLVDGLGEALLAPLRVAARVLPANRTPVVLGVAALTVLGALDWPVAIAAGLGYEALRRWAPTDDRARRR